MSRTITWFVGIGVLPLGLAWAVYLLARELLSWPLLGARLWGVAVAFLLIAIGHELCQRFLEAGDRKRQPHEVGRFLARLTSLHGVAGLAAAAAYLLSHLVLGGTFLPPVALLRERGARRDARLWDVRWILFPEPDWYRAGRVLLREGRWRGRPTTMRSGMIRPCSLPVTGCRSRRPRATFW